MKTFLHAGCIGDIVYSLPSIVSLAGDDPAVLFLQLDAPATYSAAGQHPLKNVLLNRDYADRLSPLLRAQPYLADVQIWDGRPVDFDLNRFRTSGFPHRAGDIARYYRHAFNCQPCTWKPWLTAEPDAAYAGMILVNRTLRYRSGLSYAFLRAYADRLLFVGLPDEYADFRKAFGLNIPHWLPANFLAVARAIAACRLFIGNQSACFAIAEALKVPRIVEICPYVPNNIPNGANGFEAVSQPQFESLVKAQDRF